MTIAPSPANYVISRWWEIILMLRVDFWPENRSKQRWTEAEKQEEVLPWRLQMVCQEEDIEVTVSETHQVSILTRSESFLLHFFFWTKAPPCLSILICLVDYNLNNFFLLLTFLLNCRRWRSGGVTRNGKAKRSEERPRPGSGPGEGQRSTEPE